VWIPALIHAARQVHPHCQTVKFFTLRSHLPTACINPLGAGGVKRPKTIKSEVRKESLSGSSSTRATSQKLNGILSLYMIINEHLSY
jgi:hypothetical protein